MLYNLFENYISYYYYRQDSYLTVKNILTDESGHVGL